MRASDVVNQLRLELPQHTDAVTDQVAVNSLTRAGTIVTAACTEPHNLAPGEFFVITGAETPLPVVTFTRVGSAGTITLSANHDLTNAIASTVTVQGAAEPEFTGTFEVIKPNGLPNRLTIKVRMTDAGPTAATGGPITVLGASSELQSYNGAYGVLAVLDAATFTFEQLDTTLADPVGTIVARTKPRISYAIEPERIAAAYTKQPIDKLWIWVVLEDVTASKSRQINSDAVDGNQRGEFLRQQLVESFSIYAAVPVTESVSGQAGRDAAGDLFQPLCQSILGFKFDSQLAVGKQGPVQFVTHALFDYNSAVYLHVFGFQQTVDLSFDDSIGPDLDVAFRCIDMTQFPEVPGGTGVDSWDAPEINLDEEPL